MGEHDERIEAAFTAQAPAFEDPRLNGVFTTDVGWMLADLTLTGGELALDVAAGTGHVARALAPHVRSVIALDATTAMLEAGQTAAQAAPDGRRIVFAHGDAAALPFLDCSFDVVVCRFALHHLADAAAAAGEMGRCVRPGGALVLADLLADPDAAVAGRQDELERRRDPSHTTLVNAARLAELARAAVDATTVSTLRREIVRPLAPWLEQTATAPRDAEAIRVALDAELAGGPATGFGPERREVELWFRQRFAAVTARRP